MKKKELKVVVTPLTDWKLVRELARTTVNKNEPLDTEVSDEFKRRILLAEHSPIRALMFRIHIENIPYYSSVHFVRHKFGVEHFVGTQRTDRTGVNRNRKRQDALVCHDMIINAQEIMFMARRRLCTKADAVTRGVMNKILNELEKVDPTLASLCYPMCVYRCGCVEAEPCGWYEREITKLTKDIMEDQFARDEYLGDLKLKKCKRKTTKVCVKTKLPKGKVK